jgi:hypothetical protein
VEEHIRPNVEQALTTLAINDIDFVRSVRADPESALPSYGFALNPAEMEFVKSYLGENAELSDEQIIEKLQQPQPMAR